MEGIFVTAINCMDGRTQIPVIEWMKRRYSADFVDMITEPGPIKILSEDKDRVIVESIKRRVEISIKKHNSKLIVIVGHHDCAGNPVEKDMQLKQLICAIKKVKKWNYGIEVMGLWVDDEWKVNEIH